MNEIGVNTLTDVVRELEEAVEHANLLAMELTLKSLEDEDSADWSDMNEGICRLVDRTANATEEIERMVRRLKAA